MVHQHPEGLDVGGQVLLEVAGLGHGEVGDVVDVGGHGREIPADEVGGDAGHAGAFEPLPRPGVAEAGDPDDVVVLGQGEGHGEPDLTRRTGDEDAGTVQLGHRRSFYSLGS